MPKGIMGNGVWSLIEALGVSVASYADALWARHAIFLSHERGGERLRDEPKERLRRRLVFQRHREKQHKQMYLCLLFSRW